MIVVVLIASPGRDVDNIADTLRDPAIILLQKWFYLLCQSVNRVLRDLITPSPRLRTSDDGTHGSLLSMLDFGGGIKV